MHAADHSLENRLFTQIVDTTVDVLKDVMGVAPVFLDISTDECPAYESGSPRPMSIQFSGTLYGLCVLSMDSRFTGLLLGGMGFDAIPAAEQAEYATDAVGELLNIIMGNILLYLGKTGIDLDIGSPVLYRPDLASCPAKRIFMSESDSGIICLAIHLREDS